MDSIRLFAVEGYERLACLGHASASSLATLRNSTVSNSPVASTALAPAALYLSHKMA